MAPLSQAFFHDFPHLFSKVTFLLNVRLITYMYTSGKYVPAISYRIHKMNSFGSEGGDDTSSSAMTKGMRMPLKGLAIGDGLCDPRHQLDYGDFLYQVGLLDEADRDLVQERTELAKLSMELQQWHQATDVSTLYTIKMKGRLPTSLYFGGLELASELSVRLLCLLLLRNSTQYWIS